MNTTIIILLVPIFVVVVVSITIYNSIIRRRNQVENAFGGMDAQLKKRYDLIPNLISTVKQYMQHERDLLEKITQLRTRAISESNTDERIGIDNKIADAMKQLMISVENYPDLKSNINFIDLQRALNEVESQIAASRRAYNAAVTDYNNGIETFPNSIIAGMSNFSRKRVFEIQEVERQDVDVDGLFNN